MDRMFGSSTACLCRTVVVGEHAKLDERATASAGVSIAGCTATLNLAHSISVIIAAAGR